MKTILVTGAAGFIGSSLVDRLLALGHEVIGLDNFNNFYDWKIKEKNLEDAKSSKNFKLYKGDIVNFRFVGKLFKNQKPQIVVHLAARAGVRPSINAPLLYKVNNVLGTVNLLKVSVGANVEKFIFGSSSSVYGNSKKLPFAENDPCFSIISPYGTSKKAAEEFVGAFDKTYGLKTIILRFFTVYGPRGRPDMAPALFSKALKNSQPIIKFGDGQSSRDYTYIDDIVAGIVAAVDKDLYFEVINLGNNKPVSLDEFILTLEEIIGKKAIVLAGPKQIGDVEKTWANIVKAKQVLDWQPKIRLEDGLKEYIRWLKKQ